MASTNKTRNLRLSQFSADDKPSWLTDYNGDMRILDDVLDSIMERMYPIGSYYASDNGTNPGSLFGFGVWQRAAVGRMLLGVDEGDAEFAAAGKTGGEKNHTLTVAEMPSHGHPADQYTGYWLYGGEQGALGGGGGVWAHRAQTVPPQGGGVPHNNMPPYETAFIWKRVE